MKFILQLTMGCILLAVLFLTSLRWVEASGRSAVPLAKEWGSECVDCPHIFGGVMDHALAWDAAGQPHLAYGGDHLYHAWHDGTRWQIEVVDPAPYVGAIAALDLDSQGRPHIAYHDETAQGLKYARWSGTAWEIQPLVGNLWLWGTGDLALVLDASDRPHIVYSFSDNPNNSTEWELSHLYQNGTTWVEEHMGQQGRWSPIGFSLALDRADRLHVSYSRLMPTDEGTVASLVYAVREGAGWSEHEQVIVTDGRVTQPSLALDAQGKAHISYLVTNDDATTVELRYSVWDGHTWQNESIKKSPEGQGVLGSTSLALDEQSHPHIGYSIVNGQGLEYARFDGSSWSHQIAVHSTGSNSSLGLDPAGRPFIVYRDALTLNAARGNGGAWSTEVIDRWSVAGLYNTLVLDGADRPHILYQEAYSNLAYAYFDGEQWVRQIITQGMGASRNSGLVIDAQGRPHISYVLSDMVLYATLDGGQWRGAIVDRGAQGSYALWSDIALDSAGRPHIAYSVENSLRYATFDGTSWSTQSIAGAGEMPARLSLALDSADRPHISYTVSDGLPDRPRYAHWDGTTWTVQRFAQSSERSVMGTSIVVDAQQRPHIAYGGQYARWDGQAWIIESLLAASPYYDEHEPSLTLDSQGRPHIGYTGGNYVHWDGQQWVYETMGFAAGYMYLTLDRADQPHLSYEERGDLKYARLKETSSSQSSFRLYVPLVIQ